MYSDTVQLWTVFTLPMIVGSRELGPKLEPLSVVGNLRLTPSDTAKISC